jgi:hypothetical protein
MAEGQDPVSHCFGATVGIDCVRDARELPFNVLAVLFATEDQAAVNAERTAIVLGFATLAFALALFASCRTFASLLVRLGVKNPAQNRAYRALGKYHMYYWWFFGVSVLSHVIMATFHTGLPQANDPDAAAHWTVWLLGLASAFSGAALFSSCRISPRLLAPTIPTLSLTNKVYRSFFGRHAFYWLALALFVAAHFIASYLHAGLWPAAG